MLVPDSVVTDIDGGPNRRSSSLYSTPGCICRGSSYTGAGAESLGGVAGVASGVAAFAASVGCLVWVRRPVLCAAVRRASGLGEADSGAAVPELTPAALLKLSNVPVIPLAIFPAGAVVVAARLAPRPYSVTAWPTAVGQTVASGRNIRNKGVYRIRQAPQPDFGDLEAKLESSKTLTVAYLAVISAGTLTAQ